MYLIYFRRFLLLTVLDIIASFELIPERANVTYFNEKYITYAAGNVRRAGRRLPYFINFEITIRHTWGNNVTVHYYFYEFLHNEYRRSFLEFHFKLCDFFKNEPYIGNAVFRQYRIKCPVAAGNYKMMNMTFTVDKFPNVVPFEKSRVYAVFEQNENGDMIFKGYADILMKNRPLKRRKRPWYNYTRYKSDS
ncbi:uncharacterized protein LOC126367624 [Pectinophora gossypiella]|uniref:uncharacterized protein LOC126367624 n=1 Tax=Pectinophora gossypiella TaxID=13191 RepID=UPI00214EE928|nr:uncharacterized protein LOC126367624 [Pectinophora gossypiella]